LFFYGIEVVENEESYTAKSDALVCDILPKYDKKQPKKYKFLGKRLKRGLYRSSNGKLINADVNGAINILRKVIGDDFVKNLANKEFVYNPVIWCFAQNN
jgi:putative transposase